MPVRSQPSSSWNLWACRWLIHPDIEDGSFSLDSFRIFPGSIFKLICIKMSLPLWSNGNWLYSLCSVYHTRVYLLIINWWTFGSFSLEGQLNGYKVESYCGLNFHDVRMMLLNILKGSFFLIKNLFRFFLFFKTIVDLWKVEGLYYILFLICQSYFVSSLLTLWIWSMDAPSFYFTLFIFGICDLSVLRN